MPDRIASHASRSGLDLNDEALQALEGLPEEHALELLDATASKFQSGQLKSPSNYVCATIARGYVPRSGKDGGGKGGDKGDKGGAKGIGPALSNAEYEVAAAALINTPGMQRAEAVGLQLTDEAVHALLRLPSPHASEILDAVADKHAELRDPSNYVVATIARGYSPRKGGDKGGEKGGGSGGGPRDLYETIYGASQGGAGGGYGSKGDQRKGDSGKGKYGKGDYGKDYGNDHGRDQGKGGGKKHGMLPHDVTRLESAVLELNDMDLWMGQEIAAGTMITLRCVGEEHAIDMLENLKSKGMSKGGKGISSVNNYIQAAVAKVVREGGASSAPASGKGGKGPNYTGNHSRQKAIELGLRLDEEAFSFLARMPLRSAMGLMERAADVQAQGEDPNAFLEKEGAGMGDMDADDRDGRGQKRARLDY